MMASGCVEAASPDTQLRQAMDKDIFKRINYPELKSRQQENYNFQKIAALLADYGYNCLRLSDDWLGADFIASHIDGNQFLKVQLKSRLEVNRKYSGKNIYIAFPHKEDWYVFPHDEVMDILLANGFLTGTKSWDVGGAYSWGGLIGDRRELLKPYLVPAHSRHSES